MAGQGKRTLQLMHGGWPKLAELPLVILQKSASFMSNLASLISVDSTSRNPEFQQQWDRLWDESDSRLPIARWEQIELWHSVFAPNQELNALIIERDNRWVAGLPLVGKRIKKVLPVWDVPYDDWTGSHELLVASDAARDSTIYDPLVTKLRELRRPLCRIAQCSPASEPNAGLIQAFARAGSCVDLASRHDVGVIDLTGANAPQSWEAYQAAWSGNFRRQMRKMAKRAEELGGVELVVHQPNRAEDVAALVQEGFAIEDRSWKGRDGSSVMRTPGMIEYFTRQAELLAANGELVLLFLKHKDALIAFEFGWSCRRVYYSPKIGFDESFGHLSPGQLLRYLWVERLFADQTHDKFDFAGPLSEATEKWTTSRYSQVRLMAGTNLIGSGLIHAFNSATRLRNAAKSLSQWVRQQAQSFRRPRAVETIAVKNPSP